MQWESEGFESRTPTLRFRVAEFDGPLDLLLHLIQRDQIDIYNIPIATITEEYCRTIELMETLDLDVAGEYLVMAATLMRIKARMLVPRLPGDEEEEEEDPRDALVRQLLEYRKFKEASETLKAKEEERRLLFERGYLPEPNGREPAELVPVSLFALIDILQDVLRRTGPEFFHDVVLEEVTIEEKMDLLLAETARLGRVLFQDLLAKARSRIEMIVTFLAILELLKQGTIAALQEGTFGPLWIYPAAPAEGGVAAEGTHGTD